MEANSEEARGLPDASFDLPPGSPRGRSRSGPAGGTAGAVPIAGPPASMEGAAWIPSSGPSPLAPPPPSMALPPASSVRPPVAGPPAGGGGGSGKSAALIVCLILVVAAAVAFGPKALDAIDGDQCRDVASMSSQEQLNATRNVLDNGMVDYSDARPEDWVDDLLYYCASHPDDDLDDLSPFGI